MNKQNWGFICNTYPEAGNLYQSTTTIFQSSFPTLFANLIAHIEWSLPLLRRELERLYIARFECLLS